MNILLSNDDGVYAEGLQTLVKVLGEASSVQVVAPDRDRSGASNSLSITRPVRIKTLPGGFVSVEGTPTDCVHIALTGLLTEKPDMVVSGINHGANLGDDILYSGTVAAAIEGRSLGLPAVAVSLAGEELRYFDTAAEVTRRLVLQLRDRPLPVNTILNVNVPDIPFSELQGFEITRLGTRHCAEPSICTKDPRDHVIYWIGPPGSEQDAGPGSDFYAIHMNKVSITPLHIDLTHYQAFESLSNWIDIMDLSAPR